MGHTPLWAFMYEPELPDDVGPAKEILEKYSKIPADQVDSHLHKIRDKAWAVVRYPCIGRWRFLYLTDPANPIFREVLGRLMGPAGSREALLDLGCCMGQTLRQLRYHGAPGARLYGSDLQRDFVELGYELFLDRDVLGATFATGDMLRPDDPGLAVLDGKVTMVHAQSFFHLFDRAQQLAVAQRLVRFLRPGTTDAIVYGRQIGSVKAGEMQTARRTWFLHDQESFQELWDEVGERTGTRWKVELEQVSELPIQIPGLGKETRLSKYIVRQVA